MPMIAILCILLLLAAGAVWNGYIQAQSMKKNNAAMNTKNINQMSDKQISDQLSELKPQENRDDQISAMCYEMSVIPDQIEYVCPKCGEKTFYSFDIGGYTEIEMEVFRDEFNKLLQLKSGCTLTLDETSFCAHCTPNAAVHAFTVNVKYPDKSIHTATPVSLDDLYILKAFFGGYLSYTSSDGTVHKLKNEISRLKDLLGEKIDPVRFQKLKD